MDTSAVQSWEKFELKKTIGIWSAVALLAGTMVGSGIFVSPSGLLQGVNGNVGISLVLWASCGLLALLAALCYAELGTRISESGADFAYHGITYGKPMGFIYAWTSIIIVRSTGSAAMAITFGIYLAKPFYPGDCVPPDIVVKFAGTILLLLLTLINCWSVKASTKFQNFFTAAKFFAMIIIIIGGLVQLGKGNPIGKANFDQAFDTESMTTITFTQIGLAFYQGLFSYDGWNNLNYVTEEVKESHKTLPRAILIAVPLVTGFYVLMNVAYLSVLTPNEMITSPAVAISFGDRVLGSFSWIIPVTVCLSTAGSLNGSYLSGGRMPFVTARAGQWPSVPIVIPIIVTLSALYLVIAPIVDSPNWIYLYAVIFIISGLIPYFALIHKGYKIPGIDTVTMYGQLIFNAAPTDWEDIF
ncbi:b(0,+)-type amino acid transporter 1-like isoform X2 [Styela clava]|uniref:b(0,+)-type amino acid transporter 1-like isoform X2 n=1 Tax=Styela clava TaxID=7725 RepID=UPI00193AD9EA|nr:b(0,+)-type amino acid transporter 1-like isoform X2 [Styela clava]